MLGANLETSARSACSVRGQSVNAKGKQYCEFPPVPGCASTQNFEPDFDVYGIGATTLVRRAPTLYANYRLARRERHVDRQTSSMPSRWHRHGAQVLIGYLTLFRRKGAFGRPFSWFFAAGSTRRSDRRQVAAKTGR